jgi:hypothetical protein
MFHLEVEVGGMFGTIAACGYELLLVCLETRQ